MADQRTMAQLLQEPTEGYEDAIVVLAITADNFELKHGVLTLVQNKQFFGHDKEDPYAHIRYFNKITSTLKFPNVPNTSIKLMLFPFSLEGAARIWLEKKPSRSIFTWDDLVSKFINQFFSPSKTTNLRNEITNFQQCFDESFSEAWDRFKDHLRACPHHGFSELHQLDTFYNALNSKDQDSLNSAASVVTKVSMNTSTFGISPDVVELKDMMKALLLDKKSQNQAPATVKAVEESCVTCGGSHSYRNCPATDGNVYRDNIQELVSQASAVNYNQRNTSYRPSMMNNHNRFNQNQNRGNNFNHGPVYQPPVFQPPAYQAPAPQTQGVSKEDFSAYIKADDTVMRNMQTQGQNMQNQLTNLTDLLTRFVNFNNASTLSSGTLPSNTIAKLRNDLKEITNQSGVSYDGPQILPPPSFLPNVSKSLNLTSEPDNSPTIEPVISPVSAPRPNLRPLIPYPARMQDQKLRNKANDQREKFFQIFNLNFNIIFVDALILMPKFGPSIKSLLNNKDKLCELARTPLNEHCSTVLLKKLLEKLGDPGKFLIPCDFLGKAECLALADLDASINLMPLFVWNKLSLPDLTPTYFDADPRVPLILGRSFLKTGRALIDVFEGELTLRVGQEAITFNLDQTSRYSANYSNMTAKRIDVIDMDCEEYSHEVLVDAFIALDDDPTSSKVDQSYLNPEGDILLLELFLNYDPSLPPPNQGNYLPEVRKELKTCEAKSDKSSIDEPPEVELKDLPPHLKYAFLEGDDKLPVIVAKYLSVEEKTALITVLKSHKRAIA
nr:reverse transcriptase domain-containing protein [Tanacetum cinerariifolium]